MKLAGMLHLRRSLSLRQQISGLAVLSALFAAGTVVLLVFINDGFARRAVQSELDILTVERLVRSVQKATNVCHLAHDYIQKSVNTDLGVADSLLAEAGGVRTTPTPAAWNAINQYTQDETHITAPTWALANQPLLGDRSFQHHIPVIDDASQKTGEAVTLFQRVNSAGDMLRVATSVPAADGKRAIGTYIPSRMPDGSPNAVVQAVLRGQTYRGRAFVVNAWYITAYEPVLDAHKQTIGMLFVGVRQEGVSTLIDAIAFAAKSGEHSSVSIYYGPDSQKSKDLPVAQPKGIAADTSAQWLPIVLADAPTLEDGKTRGLTVVDPKSGAQCIIQYAYFKPWDWIIVGAADSRDFQGPAEKVRAQFVRLLQQTITGGLITLILAAILTYLAGKRISDPMAELSISLTSSATAISSSALAQQADVASFMGSSHQIATAVNEISATSRELLRAMSHIAEAAEQTAVLARDGRHGLKALAESRHLLSSAAHSISSRLAEIRNRADRIDGVVTAITRISQQTNLLSLNAAIEAEKAGEAGAGFAVVAREVRRLADQSARATLDIETIVDEMKEALSGGGADMRGLNTAVQGGIASAEAIGGQFGEIIERVESIAPRYETVEQGMQNQALGAQQIGQAMAQLTETARQTADSVAVLNEVSRQLHEAVRVLKERVFNVKD